MCAAWGAQGQQGYLQQLCNLLAHIAYLLTTLHADAHLASVLQGLSSLLLSCFEVRHGLGHRLNPRGLVHRMWCAWLCCTRHAHCSPSPVGGVTWLIGEMLMLHMSREW